MKIVRLSILMLIVMLSITAVGAQDDMLSATPQEHCDSAVPADDPVTREFTGAEQVTEAGVDYRAIFCTESGAVYVDLLEAHTPITVNNFVFLAQNDYYNNINFHRVIADFMVQGGDPTNTGTGSPGYRFEDEFISFLTFDKPGLLAMANSGPATNGGQFFITTVPTPHLNGAHTIFGEVLEGQENVDNLRLRDPQNPGGDDGSALYTVLIVTDPDVVVTSYVAPPPATQEDIESALNELASQLPPVVSLDDESSGTFNTDEVIARAPADMQEAYGDLLATQGHQFRVGQRLLNTDCLPPDQIFFSSMSYSVDAFESSQAAAAFLSDDVLMDMNAADGFEQDGDGLIFTRPATHCDGSEAVHGRSYVQRGSYVGIAEVILPVTFLEQVEIDLILEQGVMNIFEGALGSVYRSALR